MGRCRRRCRLPGLLRAEAQPYGGPDLRLTRRRRPEP
ncbi:hypothetical protein PLANTIT3_60956 [Plantibacter sp. T3]|nr:hypothetical protein PLANTIT3_60956 [Plantibacter sp. T3]